MREIVLIRTACSIVLALLSGIAGATCMLPSDQQLREWHESAIALLPHKLAELVPDAVMTADWSAHPGAVVLTNGAGTQRAIDLTTGTQAQLDTSADDSVASASTPRTPSPDGGKAIEAEGFDLVLVDVATGARRRLTTDGTDDLAYGIAADTGTPWLTRRLSGEREPPYGVWSPDGRYFATLRVDQRGLRSWPILIAGPQDGGHRLPVVQTSRIALPGDQKVPAGQTVILDTTSGNAIDPRIPPLLLSYQAAPIGGMAWSDDSGSLWAGQESRDYRRLDIWVYELASRTARIVTTEVGTAAALRPSGVPAVFDPIGAGDEFVLYSERDGRGHLYLHDGRSGKLKRRLTEGAWSVVPGGWGTLQTDLRTRIVYFTAVGREPGRDPYYHHLYRLKLDDGPIELLTPEDAHHHVDLSVERGAFVDRHSTPATGTGTTLRRVDGELIARIAEVNTAPLRAIGWTAPERFRVLAADGKTPLWGTLVRPPRNDGARCHPIVDAIYAGPQTINAEISFLADSQLMNATAQLGFLVMQLDARGTPLRERPARDATWGRAFGSQVVADDHAAAIRQLAERFDLIDPERVGIYGHSWGGYYTVRAMAQRPEVFKVGIASAGSHDNYLYSYEHARWFGTPQEFPDTFVIQSNLSLAPRMRGHLLLAHGDADDDVHVINTILMAGALAKSRRPFDMLILPDLNHGTLPVDEYFIQRRWAYLVQHLLGVRLPAAGISVAP